MQQTASQTDLRSQATGRMAYQPDRKLEKSSEFFKQTRVSSCSYVKLKKGNAEAVPFYQIADKNSIQNEPKSIYTSSLSHETFKVKQNLHVGSATKLLEPYHPTAFRNRLPVEDAPVLTKNASQVDIGERNTAKNVYGNFGQFGNITNPGILSEKTKWHHHLQQK